MTSNSFGAFLRRYEYGHAIFDVLWCVPIALVIGYELATQRRVHPVYVVGAVLFLLRVLAADVFMQSALWLSIGRGLLRLFVPG